MGAFPREFTSQGRSARYSWWVPAPSDRSRLTRPALSGHVGARVFPLLGALSILCAACGARPTAAAESPPRAPSARDASSTPPARPKEPSAPDTGSPSPSATARAAEPPAAPLNGAVPSGIGDAGPIDLEAAAPDGRWVAYCQATSDTNGDGRVHVSTNARGEIEGDALQVHIALAGKVEAVDELLTYDASGRWLVVRADAKTWLVDARSGERIDLTPLSPDVRSDEMFEVGHRALSFDSRGEQLLVLTHLGRFRYEAHLLALTDPAQAVSGARKITLPPGETWRVRLAPDGTQVIAQSVLYDPARTGNFQWPAPLRDRPVRRCQGPIPRAGAWTGRGGEVTTLLASTDDLVLHPTPGFVMPLRGGWLRRERNGRLLLVRGGTQKQVASERCGARVLHADTERDLFLISCEHHALEKPKVEERKNGKGRKSAPPKFRFELYLVAPGFVKDLEADLPATNSDHEPSAPTDLVPLRPGARSVLIDLERRRLLELLPDDRIVSVHGPRALVRRGSKLILFDATTQKERELASRVATFPTLRSRGSHAFVEPYLVELTSGAVPLEHAGSPLTITTTGRLLVPETPASADEWARGPLRWIEPPAPTGNGPASGATKE